MTSSVINLKPVCVHGPNEVKTATLVALRPHAIWMRPMRYHRIAVSDTAGALMQFTYSRYSPAPAFRGRH